jgi:membrane-associated phospholipid phosphatase
MSLLHIPHFMGRILVAALMVQVICAVINIWWKISTHTAAIGGLAGGLVAFAHIFSFNPLWWLCLIIFLAGLLGSSRMFLRQHSLPQVVTGFFVGFMTAWISMI